MLNLILAVVLLAQSLATQQPHADPKLPACFMDGKGNAKKPDPAVDNAWTLSCSDI